MKIYGIDPAPSKRSTVFNGRRFFSCSPKRLKKFVRASRKPTFIGWDAPLGASLDEKYFDLYSRVIERFFNNQRKDLKIPKGISTLGYAGCPHWTITQYVFSLPILDPSHQKSSCFYHLQRKEELGRHRFIVVETHPALSIWLFLKKYLSYDPLFSDSWQYKGNISKELKQARISKIVETFFEKKIPQQAGIEVNVKEEVKKSDDRLDAFVCYMVSALFVDESDLVAIYGDEKRGSFLLPYDPTIYKQFENFVFHK